MMWAAILYAVAGSYLTYLFGRPLVRVNFDLERYNADFRYRMVRVRENAESIALYNGEPDEGRRLDRAFGRIYDAYWQYMRYTKRLIWLQSFYGQAAIVFPFFVAAPRYFSGQIQLGTLMQISSAFGTVQRSLSWFVNTYTSLADWKAMMDRLTTFSESMESTRREALGKSRELKIETQPRRELALDDLQLLLPDGRVLLDDVDLQVQAGDRLVLQGPSGSGKTTLFRALSGLWPFGRGRVRVPAGARMLFLPQRPYTPIGTLREAVCYPDKPERHDDAAITEALAAARVGHLASRLDETANWSMILSGGEQQRLAFARAILVRPDWLFLDEATSALDEPTETALYELVRERLPGDHAHQHRPQARRRPLPRGPAPHRPGHAPGPARAARSPGRVGPYDHDRRRPHARGHPPGVAEARRPGARRRRPRGRHAQPPLRSAQPAPPQGQGRADGSAALHVQCPWRIEGPDGLVTGRATSGSRSSRSPGPSTRTGTRSGTAHLQDRRMAEWLGIPDLSPRATTRAPRPSRGPRSISPEATASSCSRPVRAARLAHVPRGRPRGGAALRRRRWPVRGGPD
jgi:energy-coupling factor transporter ATP-binding protein EcfA2